MHRQRSRARRKKYYNHFPLSHSDPRVTKSKRLARFAKLAFLFAVLLFLGLFVIFPLLAVRLPSPDKIVRLEGFSTKILDRNGEVLYDIFIDQKRTPIELKEVPDFLKQSTVAIEDKNFYHHRGFDPMGYARAVFNIIFKHKVQGGSTLTQQLVKNVLLSPERTITRKIKEFVITIQIESRYSKDEILQMYLNEVPYGGTAWGVEAAAETYFGKKVKDLNLVESAFLAGLPQSPSKYSPYSSTPDAYLGRTEQVLRRLREDDYITKEQEASAVEELSSLAFQPRGASFKAPHFVQYVQKLLTDRYGERVVEQGGLRVTTTLDLSLQETVQSIVSEEIAKVESLDIGNGAAVVLDSQTGEILAMVGSKDFNAADYDGQVNVALSLRQPGSAIKPITYLTAFKKGYTPSSLIMDVPTVFPGGINNPEYKPENYDGKYRGPIQFRYALANSINVAAVKVLALVGIKNTLETAFTLGLTSLEPTKETLNRVGLSLTLGGGEVRLLELTAAYAAFMNSGYKVEPVAILKVEDQSGKVLEEHKSSQGKAVLTPQEAYLITDILSDNEARSAVFGTNSLLNIPSRQVAVKTGTTNDKRDNWTIGGTAQVVAGVWVGNNDNSPMREVASGVSGASPIWRRSILAALEGKPNITFERPEGIVTATVDKLSGYRSHDGFPDRTEIFIKGTEPGEDPAHLKLKLCKGEGKLATPSDIVAGNFEEKEFYLLKEEDPTAGPGAPNRWQEGILNWLSEQADPRYHPPQDYCSGVNAAPLNVEFASPHDHDSNLPNTFSVKFTVDSIHGIDRTELEIDGIKIRSFTALPYEHEVNLTDGIHRLRAIAIDRKGNQSDRRITVGVKTAWDSSPTPTP